MHYYQLAYTELISLRTITYNRFIYSQSKTRILQVFIFYIGISHVNRLQAAYSLAVSTLSTGSQFHHPLQMFRSLPV